MKQNTHPTYYKEAKASCVCGHAFTVGSTKEKIEVEICAHCHPFYTGKQTLVDAAGRADRFKKRAAKADAGKVEKKKEKKTTRAAAKKPKVIELKPKSAKHKLA